MARLDDALTDERIELYSRQILLPELGGRGQRRLLRSSCLLVGTDEALTFAATYLAGAGVGHLDLLAASDVLVRPLHLAELSDRCPDARVHRLLAAPSCLSRYDAVVASAAAAHRLARSMGEPRSGSLRIEAARSRAVDLLLLPAGAGLCPLCARAAGGPPTAASASEGTISAALAGALAALAVARWIAGIADEREGARALRLGPNDATWREVALGPAAPCPRPCRGRGGPVT